MKFIEEYIRNLLGQEAPPPLDADDLWAGIANGLPEEEEPVAGVPGFRHRGLAGLILLFLLLGGGAFWLLLPGFAGVGEEAGATTQAPGIQRNTSEQDLRAAAENIELSDLNFTKIRLTAEDNLILGKSQTKQPSSPASSTYTAPAAAPQNSSVENHLTPSKDTATVGPAPSATPAPSAPSTTLSPLSTTSINHIDFTRINPNLNRVTLPFKTTTNSRLSLGFHAGGNLQVQRLAASGDDVGNSLHQASGLATGQTVALDLRYRLNKHLSVSLGAEYHRTISTFRHTINRDTLVPHPTPPNTRFLASEVFHSVSHNNRSQLLSAPVMLSYHRRFGDFSAAFSAGLSANYRLSANGRSLDATGNFVRYDEPAYDRFFLACHLRPELAWRPKATSSWTVEFRADVRYFDLGASTTIGAAQTGWLITPTLGVRRSITE